MILLSFDPLSPSSNKSKYLTKNSSASLCSAGLNGKPLISVNELKKFLGLKDYLSNFNKAASINLL